MSPIYTFCTAVVANHYIFSHCIMVNIGSLILVNRIMMQCFSHPVVLMGLSTSTLVAAGVASLVSLTWGGYAGLVAWAAAMSASVTWSAALAVRVISTDAPFAVSKSTT